MQNERRIKIRTIAKELEQEFLNAGALYIEADSLLPADILLDLYGEDIRARAYVTYDPVLGERIMRPDFTVPIVKRHMSEGTQTARYTYNGTVWRMQNAGSNKSTEFTQVGFELFDRSNPAENDAEVFSLFARLLPSSLKIKTGDVGLLRTAVNALNLTEYRKQALLRHLWRPKRFTELLNNFASDPIKNSTIPHNDDILEAGKFIGLRSSNEIITRLETLRIDAKTPPIHASELTVISTLLNINKNAADALITLQELQKDLPKMAKAISIFARRLDALDASGIDVNHLIFSGNYGLTSMEYYDGFVFSFYKDNIIVATGGRYDALTRHLGEGREIPAIGGVIRPDLLIGKGISC